MNLMPNLKNIFKENLEIAKSNKSICPTCGGPKIGTFRHKGAPAWCEQGHKWGSTCGHGGECQNTEVKESLSTDPVGGSGKHNNNSMDTGTITPPPQAPKPAPSVAPPAPAVQPSTTPTPTTPKAPIPDPSKPNQPQTPR